MKSYITEEALLELEQEEAANSFNEWLPMEPKTTWYIFEEIDVPTWKPWGEEKSEGAIYTVCLKKVRYHHPSPSITTESSEDEDSISHLEWETVRVRFLKAATLEKLVESVASPESGELETTFVNVLLATYRTFATTRQLIDLMLQRYLALDNLNNNTVGIPKSLRENHKKALRLTLQVWLDTYVDDFRDPPQFHCLHLLLEFFQAHLPESDLLIKINYKLEKMRKEELAKGSPVLQRILSCEDFNVHCISSLSNGEHKPSYEFLDIPEALFSQQLTRMDTVLFKAVIAHQCLGAVWSRRDRSRGETAASVIATIEQFNAISFRVQSTILVDTDLKPSQRARIIVKWIDIAQNEIFEELARIFSEDNNQLNQREILMKEGTAKYAQTAHADDRHLPKAIEKLTVNPLSVIHGTIPYLGTFLTDLNMIDTAIPDTIGDGLINFDKKRKEFEVLAQIRLLQGAANAYHFVTDEQFERWWDSVLVLDDKEAWTLSSQIEPQGSAHSSAREAKIKKRAQLGHHKNDSIASTSSGSSSSQFFLDNDSLNSPMSTSSSTSSLQSLDVSVHSTGTCGSATRTPERSSSLPHQTYIPQMSPLTSPYINPDFYIIRVSLENESHEIEGVNLYKSIMLSNSERTPSVIRSAMLKHGIEGSSDDYTLAQLLPDGEMVLPMSANVYYAINTSYELNFVLRRRRHGDENTVIRRNPTKDHKVRKKLLPLIS